MATFFVSRHQGAIEWAKDKGLGGVTLVSHFDLSMVTRGDTVIGTLPINMVADLSKMGVKYLHLVLEIPAEMRGKDLTKEDMDVLGARLQQYIALKITT